MLELSRRHELPVLGILLSAARLGAVERRAAAFGRLAGGRSPHTRATRSPTGRSSTSPTARWAFDGTPEQYARMLRAAYDAIGARVPEAQVAMGGLMVPAGSHLARARCSPRPGADAAHAFDIANLHLRGHERAAAGGLMTAWRDLPRRGTASPARCG